MLSRLFSRQTARSLALAPVPRGLLLDATSLEVVAELPAGGWGGDAVAGPDGAWISTHDDSSVSSVGPDGAERLRVPLPARPASLAMDGERPLMLCKGGRIVRVDPVEGRLTDDVRVSATTTAIAADGGAIWLLDASDLHASGMRLRLVALDAASLAPAVQVDLGRTRLFGGLRVHAGTVSVLLEDTPGAMGYATFDALTGAAAPTPEELTRVRGMGERSGVRWIRKDRSIRRIDVASGRELTCGELDVPRVGTCLLAHDRVWAITYRPPRGGENEDSD